MQTPPIPLHPEEKLLWVGQSRKPLITPVDAAIHLLPGAVLLYLWGNMVAGLPLPVALPAEVAGFLQSGHWLLLLFGVLLMVKPFFMNAMQKRITYVFTDRRAVAYSASAREIVLEVPAAEVAAMRLVKHGKGLVSLRKWEVEEDGQGQAVNVRVGFDYIPAELLDYYIPAN